MAFTKQPVRVSVMMLIDQLREDCRAVSEAREALQALVDTRNASMVELKAAGIPERTLVKMTGLSASSVTKITTGARKHADALLIEASLQPSRGVSQS